MATFLPSMALSGLSLVMGGAATASGDQYKAQEAEKASQIGKIQADQTSTVYADRLNTAIANIKAIRASSGADPNSPSSAAYIQTQTDNSDRSRNIDVTGKLMQADQSSSDALFYKSSANSALLGGVVQSLPDFAKALGA